MDNVKEEFFYMKDIRICTNDVDSGMDIKAGPDNSQEMKVDSQEFSMDFKWPGMVKTEEKEIMNLESNMITCGSTNVESEVVQAVKCEQETDGSDSEGMVLSHKLESHFTCVKIEETKVIHDELDIKSDSGDGEEAKVKSQELNIDFRWPETVKTEEGKEVKSIKSTLINSGNVHEEFKLLQGVKCDLNMKKEIHDNDSESLARRYEEEAQWLQCKLCVYRAKRLDLLKSHFTLKHDVNAEWHHCQLCEYKTKLKKYLKAHSVSKHSENDRHRCQLCEYKTKHRSGLKRHFTLNHDDKAQWYQCELCEFKTKTKGYYNRHLNINHRNDWYNCYLCGYKTKRKDDLTIHLMRKHGYGQVYQCHSCEYKTQYMRNLKAHFTSKHDDTAQWLLCKLCEYKTKHEINLKNHFTSHHDNNAPWYQCELCEFKTKRKGYYNLHFNAKHNDKWHCSLMPE